MNTVEEPVTGISDNNYTYSKVRVSISGDLNGDIVVSSTDLGTLGGAWGSFAGDPNYNSNAVIDDSEVTDSTDLGTMSAHWGEIE